MEHQWKVGEWYKTRGGDDAQVLDVDFKNKEGAILGKIRYSEEDEDYGTWYKDGNWKLWSEHKNDLVPPVERKELWANVYKNWLSCPEKTKDEAKKSALSECIGMIHIVIEGDDFTVEKVTGWPSWRAKN